MRSSERQSISRSCDDLSRYLAMAAGAAAELSRAFAELRDEAAQSWLYIESGPGLYTAGHYDPAGHWVAESDHDTAEGAAARVHYLAGGDDPSTIRDAVADALERLAGGPGGDFDPETEDDG